MVIKSSVKSYSIYLEKGILSRLSEYLDSRKRYVLLSDSGVPQQWIDLVKNQFPRIEVLIFPNGEPNKSFQTYQWILEELLKIEVDRKTAILVLGGGVVGDLGGFVASTFKRGIPLIQIPTTTLSMVDSSIGGKTAIDVGGFKNSVGSFYPADSVFIDPLVLETLDSRNYVNGLVEAMKSGLLGDETILDLLENDGDIEAIIEKSLIVKKKYVEADEKEQGIRKHLNLGHSFGHAFESYYQGKLLHGEAVGLGLLCVLEPVYRERVKSLLKRWNCPCELNLSFEHLRPYFVQDKKVVDGQLELVCLKKIGEPYLEKYRIEDLERKYSDVQHNW